ncbi:hypothetical protein [Streptomyces jeddahensis]|uniref:Uncharacterized protein n=1 Tax=Streptomyces jeddahensis TaxID=1716141 RepID=A0A177HR49_9ACTN|nr:hypothetical protein [Streptomyces jeddahensis]OAH13069.1 hypothetical protein STSP_37160 [Streptomyces jeddahensis]
MSLSKKPVKKPARSFSSRASAFAGMGTAALLTCLPGAATAAEPAESGESDCPVVASAQGLQVMVSASDNTALQAPSGAAIPAAQACVNSGVGESSGFAGNPYPGETIVSAPALLGSQTGQKFPGYPAYASSRYPSEEKSDAGQQGLTLTSHSTKNSTRAKAQTRLGQDAASASTTALAQADVDPAKRVGKASATADTQPITVNGVLRLGRVLSAATATVDADGKLVRDARLTIGRTEVAGQVVEITRKGIRAAGQAVPLPDAGNPADPGDPADPADPAEALAAAGVRVRYLSEERTEHGVISAGLEVLARQKDPQSGAVYTLHYVFGRAFAAADRVESPPGDVEMPLPPAAVPPPTSGDDAPADSAPAPEEEPATGSDAPPDQAADEASPAPDARTAWRLAGNPADMGVTGVFLVLAFGAAATFAFGNLLRLLGVKTRWTS